MWCGAYAIAHATGCTPSEVKLRVRGLRDQRGEHLGRGGTSLPELQYAAGELGWRVRPVFRNRRVRLQDLARRITRGRWLLRQNGHWFGVRSGSDLRRMARVAPNAMVVAGWLIYPARPFHDD